MGGAVMRPELPEGFVLDEAVPAGGGAGGGPVVRAPVTFYSLGQSVGGADETEDDWTNKGYSAKGPNLVPGVAAVNPKVIPHGTVLKDRETGMVFLASDSHGNRDAGVVDLYVPPESYRREKMEREFEVVGRVEDVPRDAAGVREVLSQYGAVPEGASAAESLAALGGGGGGSGRGANEYRRTNGAWEPKRAEEIDWGAPARVVDEVVPRAVPSDAAGGSGDGAGAVLPEGFVLDAAGPAGPAAGGAVQAAAAAGLPPGFVLDGAGDEVVEDVGTKPGGVLDWVNQFSRGATSDGGIFSMTEGAARLLENVVRPDEAEPLGEMPAGAVGRWEAVKRAGEFAWKNVRESLADTLGQYAEDVAAVRGDVRRALPVTEEFQKSLAGGIVAGFGQLPASLAAYTVPGLGPLTSVGGLYDEAYQDAVANGADAVTANKAGVMSIPAGAVDVAMDKLILGKILKPLKGKLTVGQLAKTMATTAVAGGGTEGLQQGWLNFSAKHLAGYDPDRKLDEEVVRSILIGAIVDGTVTTGGQAAMSVAQRSEEKAMTSRAEAARRAVAAAEVRAPGVDADAEAEAFGGDVPEAGGPVVPEGFVLDGAGNEVVEDVGTKPAAEQGNAMGATFPFGRQEGDPTGKTMDSPDSPLREREADNLSSQDRAPSIDQNASDVNADNGRMRGRNAEAAAGGLVESTPDLDGEGVPRVQGSEYASGSQGNAAESLRPVVEMEDGRPVPVDEVPESAAFVPVQEGRVDWGSIDEKMAAEAVDVLEPAPVRVQVGWHDASGSGFGWVHAHDHEKGIKNAGWKDVGAFLEDTLANFNEVYRQPNERLLLVKRNGKKQVAVVELRREGDFYGLTTAYPERANKDLSKKAKLIWKRSEPANSLPGEQGVPSRPAAQQDSSSGQVALGTPNQLGITEQPVLGNVNPQPYGMKRPSGNPEAGFVVADLPQAVVDFGRAIYRAGMDFGTWAGQMVARFGRAVEAKLEDLWARIVAHQRRLPWAGERGSVAVPDGSSPEKRRKLIASAKAAEAVAPTVRERVEGVYRPITNEATVAEAVARINRDGLDRVLADLLAVNAPSAADYAAGIELIPRLQAGARYEDAVALIERMAERATGQGQAIQALSLLGRLTAEGVQVYAERVTAGAVKDNPALAEALAEIKRLRGDLRKARHQLATKAILDAKRKGAKESVQERLKRLLIDNKGSLWGRYREQAVNELAAKMLPGEGRKPAALEEFTRRLTRMLREHLPKPQPGAVDRGPQLTEAELIGEAVRNLEKYRDVWEAAQAEVQARLKDNPEALQSLDDYLGQVLARPFSEASVGRAVRQTLQRLNVSMREVLMQGAGDKAVVLRELQRRIALEARLSDEEAAGLARAVQEEFERGQRAAREDLLRQMTAVRDARLPVSKLKKLMGLNNAGALDDGRFFAGLARAYGIPAWTEELSQRVAALQREYERAENPEVKLAKAAQIFDAIHSVVPPAALAKVRALQNMSMLLNPKTVIRNVAGNVLLFAADVAADAVTVSAVDPLVSVVTGKRVRRSVDVAARLSGLVQPVRDYWTGYEFARSGGAGKVASAAEGVRTLLTLARLQSRGKWDVSQLNKGESRVLTSLAGRMLEDTLATVLSVPDRAFHQAAFQASIARQMENAAAEGREMVGPDAAMVEEAMMDAARAVFQDPNVASRALRQMQAALNLGEDWGVGSVIIPFTQVPGSILTRGMQWSPLGFIGAAYEMVRPALRREDFRQKEFTDGFSRAVLGSGVAAAGAWLFALGIIAALEDEDKDLEAMRRAAGLGKYLVNVSALKRAMMTGNWWTRQVAQDGDLTVNYDWAQPSAMALAMGAAAVQKKQEMGRMTADVMPAKGGALEIAGAAVKGAALTLESQPLLTGLSGLGRDVGRDGLLAGVGQQALNVPGMFVPTVVRQVGQLMDNAVRETRAGSVLDQTVARLESSIPGLAAKYPPKYDVYGDAVQRYNYGGNSFFNVMINPAFVGRVKRSRELREMERVFAASGERGVLLERAPVKVTVRGMDAELTNEQISQYQKEAGQLSMAMAARLMAAPNYARAPIGVKAEVLSKVFERVNTVVKLRTVLKNPDLVQELRSQAAERAEAARVMAGVQ